LEMQNVPPLQSAVCLDDRIDHRSKLASTNDILDLLNGFDQSKTQKLSNKGQLSTALRASAIKEHLFYFWCHGKGGGDKPHLHLVGLSKIIRKSDGFFWISGVSSLTDTITLSDSCTPSIGGPISSCGNH